MTGSTAALAGIAPNIIYAPGLVRGIYSGYAGTNTAFFDALSPFSTDIDTGPVTQSFSGSSALSALWRGYYRPASTGSATVGFSFSASDCVFYAYIWIGSAARSGYTSDNALLQGTGGSAAITLLAGQYYPTRIQLAYDGDGGFFDDPELNFTLTINSGTSYATFYNSLTNGL